MEILMKLTLQKEFLGITFNCQICRETNKKTCEVSAQFIQTLEVSKI